VTLVDTNVLIDLFVPGSEWAEWSAEALSAAAMSGPLVVNDVVFAELSIGFDTLPACEAFLSELRIGLEPMPREALFLAGRAFRDYRRRGGAREGVLPDFFIGAHAEAAGRPLLTRDAGRYRSYFPQVTLILPPPMS
jgi:predicted nucleic acid-binding protein